MLASKRARDAVLVVASMLVAVATVPAKPAAGQEALGRDRLHIPGQGITPLDAVTITDASSREYSATVGLAGTFVVTDAVSREISVAVGFAGGFTSSDASSREVSLFLTGGATFAIADGSSRIVSVLVDPNFVILNDAASREYSVFVTTGSALLTDAASREASVYVVELPPPSQACSDALASVPCCSLVVTSSQPATALPLTGGGPFYSMISTIRLNDGAPTDTALWRPVLRHADLHQRGAFYCDLGGATPNGVGAAVGACILSEPPSNITLNQWESDVEIRVFDETTLVTLQSDLALDTRPNGGVARGTRYVVTSELTPDTLAAGTMVNSALLHFDTVANHEVRLNGLVRFSTPILGLIVKEGTLNAADSAHSELLRSGVQYGTPMERGVELGIGPEQANWDTLDVYNFPFNYLEYRGTVSGTMDEVRVITAVTDSTPTDQPYVDSRSYLASADEVTFDNCVSAFYRWTFELPTEGYRWAVMRGIVNADDIAIAYLNGYPISPYLRFNEGYGTDRWELAPSGAASYLLSAPTPDSLLVCDSRYFKAGTNVLVFGVHGSTNGIGPTGVEFRVTVSFDSSGISSVGNDGRVPRVLTVGHVTPNPVRSQFELNIGLPIRSRVGGVIVDVSGRVVDVVPEREFEAGNHSILWSKAAGRSRKLASGFYHVILHVNGKRISRKFLIVH